jgi:hypothetical protein
MRRIIVLLTLVLGSTSVTACMPDAKSGNNANAPTPRRQPIPSDLKAAVEMAQGIGSQLYVLDKVASIATDVLLAHVSDYKQQNLAGYLPLREGLEGGHPTDIFLVSFYTKDEPPRLKYQVRVIPEAKPTFEAFNPTKEMPASMVAVALARQTAINALPTHKQPMNPVVMPGEAIGKSGVLVYLIAGTREPSVAVLGQHFRAIVPLGSNTVSEIEPLSKTVIELPTEGPSGEPVAALMVTHLVSDYPMETHVLASLQTKLAVYVGTRRGLWVIEKGRIAYLGELSKDESK